jgi:RNA polymerase sigma factor (sigma-70 family)
MGVSDGPPPFQLFLDTHRDEVWRLLVRSMGPLDAEDCFQETFIAALRAYPRLKDGSNLRAWVLTIAGRKAIDAHRARSRREVPVAEPDALDERAHRPAAERDEELWMAVESLPERQRSAIVLRCVGDMRHRDIAAAMGCSEDAARRSLHEGLSKLRKVVPS